MSSRTLREILRATEALQDDSRPTVELLMPQIHCKQRINPPILKLRHSCPSKPSENRTLANFYINDCGSTSTMMLVRGTSSATAFATSARKVAFNFSRLADFRMKWNR